MDLNRREFKTEFAGQELSITTSRIAEQATSSGIGKHGDTTVLVTVTMGNEDRNIDYFPLTIDYEEKFYAAGKIIGSRFIRRESRPSEEAILSGRLIDRSLRPLFDNRLRRDVQIVITVLSYDEEHDPEFVALLTASTMLAASEIPWGGPIAGVRFAQMKDGRFILNPKNSEVADTNNVYFEGFAAGVKDKINMIELQGNEATEAHVAEALAQAQAAIKELIGFEQAVIKQVGKEKIKFSFKAEADPLRDKVQEFLKGRLEEVIYAGDKVARHHKKAALKEQLAEYLKAEGFEEDLHRITDLIDEEEGALVRKNILEKERRPDNRELGEVRELYAEVGLFKRLHGSALFVRGNTQALAAVTLAAPGAEQLIETMEVSGKRRFMLHYNFPPYSTGEVGRLGAPGRREIGHGALAEKAVRNLVPTQDEFPYTIRVVSEILSSNGSSSMATVCASILALMDAGVPIKKPAAGIAMGLIMAPDGKYKILTDLQGPEDHHGDMDFKVAGTKDGITAIQLDVKIDGLTPEIIKNTLEQAKKARLEILEFMAGVIASPRQKVSEYAPVIMTMTIKPEQIGEVIGPGGKIINGIIAKTGAASIDIEQTGKVFVAAADITKAQLAIDQIKAITHEYQVGEIVRGEIIKILDFGAIVGLGGGKDGMIHISELKNGFVEKVTDVVKLGDVVEAKIIRVEDGRVGLSLKALNPGITSTRNGK